MHEAHEREYVEYVTARLPALRRLAYALCGDAHRADDIVQQAITRLYTRWRRTCAADLDERAILRAALTRVPTQRRRQEWEWTMDDIEAGARTLFSRLDADPPVPSGVDVGWANADRRRRHSRVRAAGAASRRPAVVVGGVAAAGVIRAGHPDGSTAGRAGAAAATDGLVRASRHRRPFGSSSAVSRMSKPWRENPAAQEEVA
jgi:DNA-directed RNA polymerase specialized sigma24 family protein